MTVSNTQRLALAQAFEKTIPSLPKGGDTVMFPSEGLTATDVVFALKKGTSAGRIYANGFADEAAKKGQTFEQAVAALTP